MFAGSARRSPAAHLEAAAALTAGARVIGVVPRGLFAADEVHQDVELIEVESLHARKQVMLDLGYVYSTSREHYGLASDASGVLDFIAKYEAPPAPRFLAPDQT